jgi:precorrin-6B methylase 2
MVVYMSCRSYMKDAKTLLTPVYRSEDFSSLIENSLSGLKQFYLLTTAWDIKLFDFTINPKTPQELASELGYSEVMVRIFCDALTEMGLLIKISKAYINSSMATNYLCRTSPHCMTCTLQMMKANVNPWTQLVNILKNGPMDKDRIEMFGDGWLLSIAEWAEVSSVSNTIKVITSHLDLQGWRRLLDIGGGHGLYAIAFTTLKPQLEAFVFDLPRIIPITNRYIEAYSAERVHVFPGDFYKDNIGRDYDAVFSSFNQSCSDPVLIPKLVQALKAGGDVVLHRLKDTAREGTLKALDWNLLSIEEKKIRGKARLSDDFVDRKTYLKQLELAKLTIRDIVSVDEDSEVIFARKPF